MNSVEHLRWFADNVRFFESIDEKHLPLGVATCDGWDIEKLLTHLSFGLGVCYPIAASAPPETESELVFANADRSATTSVGLEAVDTFRTNIFNCLELLGSMEPDKPCWTYSGPGTVSFWIRRAAVETTIHRYDAECALGIPPDVPSPERLRDGIDETLDFAFELACTKIGSPESTLHIAADDITVHRSIGNGDPSVTLTGEGHAMLLSLWGRPQSGHIGLNGDEDSAADWLSLVSRAFAGR